MSGASSHSGVGAEELSKVVVLPAAVPPSASAHGHRPAPVCAICSSGGGSGRGGGGGRMAAVRPPVGVIGRRRVVAAHLEGARHPVPGEVVADAVADLAVAEAVEHGDGEALNNLNKSYKKFKLKL